jgi:hypothetical protein
VSAHIGKGMVCPRVLKSKGVADPSNTVQGYLVQGRFIMPPPPGPRFFFTFCNHKHAKKPSSSFHLCGSNVDLISIVKIFHIRKIYVLKAWQFS